MDKFTKTTEIDISAMTDMEEETPKKSNIGNIIAMICCLIFAIVIWFFVMEGDSSVSERKFNDIPVSIYNCDQYNVEGEKNLDVVIAGVNKELAEIDKSMINVTLDFSGQNISLGKTGEYTVVVEFSGDVGESINVKTTKMNLTVYEK